eukprot:126444-Pyramimonas_sp.AAC.1
MQVQIAAQRRLATAAHSRASLASQQPALSGQWRRRARRIGQRSEVWKPFTKRLILAGIRISDSYDHRR